MAEKVNSKLIAMVQAFANKPGVYRFYAKDNELLYVGKARALRRRVSSYLRGTDKISGRNRMMVEKSVRIEATYTHSEADALVLEHEQINTLKPLLNVYFRDDKSYPYLRISKHATARISSHRGKAADGCYGPYPNGWAVRESIQVLQKVFRIRTCTDANFSQRSRPCLLYQIKRCSAPCVDKISKEKYAEDVDKARRFISGQEHTLADELEKKMEQAAIDQNYEKAAQFRDSLHALSQIRHVSAVVGGAPNADYIGLYRDDEVSCVRIVSVRGERQISELDFFPDNAEDTEDEQILSAFVAQYYSRHLAPPRVVLRCNLDASALAIIAGAKKSTFITRPAEVERERVEMAQANAQAALERRLRSKNAKNESFVALAKLIGIPELTRAECFDISHSMGEAAIASCVVCIGGEMQSASYRRFNLKATASGDDYGGMRETLSRRYRDAANKPENLPDLVIVDGGVGQVSSAIEALASCGVQHIAVLGVAKGTGRKPGLERLLTGDGEVLDISPTSAPFRLVQHMRDEAHRFAITAHRKKRDKKRRGSTLEDIEGIGPAKRKQLINRFGGLQGLKRASASDLSKIKGVGKDLARRIYLALHK